MGHAGTLAGLESEGNLIELDTGHMGVSYSVLLYFSGCFKHFRGNRVVQDIWGFLYRCVCKVGVKLVAEERGDGGWSQRFKDSGER